MEFDCAEARKKADETALIEAACGGDHRAFAELVERFEGRLFRFLLARTGNREDAEDLLQITFVTAYQNLGRYRKRYRFSTWLFTIAYRRTVDRLRSRYSTPPIGEDEPSSPESPADVLQRREEFGRLWSLARRVLSDKQHSVLWLRYGEDLNTNDIATITGFSRTSVKVLLHRARNTLGEHLARGHVESESGRYPAKGVLGDETWIRNPMTKSV
jgi:RNA polymerase sigma-70 factor, ECF subfamily